MDNLTNMIEDFSINKHDANKAQITMSLKNVHSYISMVIF